MSDDPYDLRRQEEFLEEKALREKLEGQLAIDDLKWVLSDKRGRRFVRRLLDQAGVYRSSFNTNAMTMSFNEGQRNEGLRLVAQMMTHCRKRFMDMLEEQSDD
jgi:hypothetical protein